MKPPKNVIEHRFTKHKLNPVPSQELVITVTDRPPMELRAPIPSPIGRPGDIAALPLLRNTLVRISRLPINVSPRVAVRMMTTCDAALIIFITFTAVPNHHLWTLHIADPCIGSVNSSRG